MTQAKATIAAPTLADPPELVAYIEHQRLRNLSPQTIRGRTLLLRRLAAWLNKPLRDATLADLKRFMGRPRQAIARATHFSEIAILRAFYSGLRELGLVDVSPAEGLRCQRVESPRQPISLECVRDILAEASVVRGEQTPLALALAQRNRACLELLFATGMRASEVGAARVVDLDLGEASVLVRRAKRGHSRVIPLPPAAVAALRRYLDEGRAVLVSEDEDDQGRLFLSMHGRPLRRGALHQIVSRVAKRCGVHAYPHVFRRTLATELARLGVSLPVIQEVLGHAQITTTASYVRVDVVDMRGPLEELDRLRPKSHAGPAILLNLQSWLFVARQVKAVPGSNAKSVSHSDYTGRSRSVA